MNTMDEQAGESEALRVFEREVGTTGIKTRRSTAGNRSFLKFIVGREAPLYQHALRETQKNCRRTIRSAVHWVSQ